MKNYLLVKFPSDVELATYNDYDVYVVRDGVKKPFSLIRENDYDLGRIVMISALMQLPVVYAPGVE